MIEAIDGVHQRGGERLGRAVEVDASLAQGDDALEVAARELHRVEARDEGLAALSAEVAEEVHDLPPALGIQAGDGLVCQDGAGVLHEHPRERDPLLLAAGEEAGALVELVGDADAGEGGPGGLDLERPEEREERPRRRPAAEVAGVHVVDDLEVLDEVELLVDGADLGLEAAACGRGERAEVRAEGQDLARARMERPVEEADEGALAGAARADERHPLALLDAEVDAGERVEVAKGLPGLAQDKERRTVQGRLTMRPSWRPMASISA